MSLAGLAHGGFYRHFESKDELVREACHSALQSGTENLRSEIRKHPNVSPLQCIITKYLSPSHRDNPGSGCAIPALGSEVARADRRSPAWSTDIGHQICHQGQKIVRRGPSKSRNCSPFVYQSNVRSPPFCLADAPDHALYSVMLILMIRIVF